MHANIHALIRLSSQHLACRVWHEHGRLQRPPTPWKNWNCGLIGFFLEIDGIQSDDTFVHNPFTRSLYTSPSYLVGIQKWGYNLRPRSIITRTFQTFHNVWPDQHVCTCTCAHHYHTWAVTCCTYSCSGFSFGIFCDTLNTGHEQSRSLRWESISSLSRDSQRHLFISW